jgi:hypothetical protein
MNMKKLMTAIALAIFVAAPAFAKTAAHKHHPAPSTRGLYMQSVPSFSNTPFGGRDPDPNVRTELQRDFGQSEGAY